MALLTTYSVRHLRFPMLAAAVTLLFAGCAGDYGRLNRDPSVSAAFQENRFSESYRFYYVGRENQPYALVGVLDTYEFRSKFWKPVDPSTEAFEKMVSTPWGYHHYYPYGAFILDSAGTRVGIWYSTFDFTTIRVTEDGGVYVHSPYTPNNGKSRGDVRGAFSIGF